MRFRSMINLGSRYYVLVPFIMFLFVMAVACKKEPRLNSSASAKLEFSSDTVLFDTVFTTVGSSTRWLKIYNPYKEKLMVSNIRVAGGATSQFRINIDGIPGNNQSEITLMPKDSIYIFVEVTVNPLLANAPLVVTDSLIFLTNGNIQDVDLVAWGQDAHYIKADTYTEGLPPYKIIAGENDNIVWQNDKPWVIYGYGVVDSAGSLQIEEGTRVHFHRNSGLWIYRYGELTVNGTKDNRVIFQGDRLDNDYRYIPGQWDRIWINEGAKSFINYALIKNGFIGIQAQTLIGRDAGDQTELRIHNTIIQDMSAFGLYTVYFNVIASNLLVHNCKETSLGITMGGNYSFRHCTFVNMDNSASRQNPSVVLNNYNSVQHIPLDSAYFGNCILYGGLENEIGLDPAQNSTFNFWFDHCVLKIDPDTDTSDPDKYRSIIKNPLVNNIADPLFESATLYDYHLRDGSAGNNAGNPVISQLVPLDLNGLSRNNPADIGALEK